MKFLFLMMFSLSAFVVNAQECDTVTTIQIKNDLLERFETVSDCVDPLPVPDPLPIPDPIPEPDPVPDPLPEPEPIPEPDPVPDPEPSPTPAPDPDPTPVPAPGDLSTLPLWDIDEMNYAGGFRVKHSKYGESDFHSADFSLGVFTYNPERHSIFLAGNPRVGSVAEYSVPEIVNTTNISEFEMSTTPLQRYRTIWEQDDPVTRELTGIGRYFRITGMELVNESLIVNYINWYDANATETDTSLVITDANNLAESEVKGPYQLSGVVHAAGWISGVPVDWQAELGGTHILGNMTGAAINSRLSLGPTAFVFNPAETILADDPGPVESKRLMSFPLPNMLYDRGIYGDNIDFEFVLRNEDLRNKLWTNISGASYGFIIPGTRTYMTIGRSGGHESGVGYKITQDNGHTCGGPCPYLAGDAHSYYWLWDVNYFIRVQSGEIQPHDIRPYDYGVFDTGLQEIAGRISGGHFDPTSNRLFVSYALADNLLTYPRTPLFLVYDINGEN